MKKVKITKDIRFKRIALVFFIVILGIYLFGGFFKGYRIVNFNPILAHNINKELLDMDEKYENKSVKIREKIKLDNILITYITYKFYNETNGTISERHGLLVYEQGFNLSYYFRMGDFTDKVSYPYLDQTVKTKKGKYKIVGGENNSNYNIIKFEVKG